MGRNVGWWINQLQIDKFAVVLGIGFVGWLLRLDPAKPAVPRSVDYRLDLIGTKWIVKFGVSFAHSL
jgi:hypothetical protein